MKNFFKGVGYIGSGFSKICESWVRMFDFSYNYQEKSLDRLKNMRKMINRPIEEIYAEDAKKIRGDWEKILPNWENEK